MNPLNLFSSVKSAVITIGVIALLTFCGVLYWQLDSAQDRIVELTAEKLALQSTVLAREIEIGGLKISLHVLEATNKRLEALKAVEDQINKDIDNAPPEADGDVAPVLRDVLSGIERLRNNPRP